MSDEFIQEDAAAFVEPEEEKTPEKEIVDESEEEGDDEAKTRRSLIAKKKAWREKAQKSSQKVQELEDELAKLREAVKKPSDEQEAKAQDYIRSQARAVFEELQKEKAKTESKQLAEFEETIASLLEDNPDIPEKELLDAIEEYEVEPKVALRILKRSEEKTGKKPRMPQARRASPEREEKTPDDSEKSMWQIAKEEMDKAKAKLTQ